MTNFISLTQNLSIYSRIGMPLKSPHLEFSIKLSIITVVQAFTPTLCKQWSANVLGGNEVNFFSGLSQNHDYKYIYPNESRKIINESNKARLHQVQHGRDYM